ncbi:MAG: DedA family protein [Thermus sp.]|uniref:DedA family protein n=1 Tax=Thermus sp. TaxID=275 RepID=UPI003D0E1D69
MNGLLLLAPLSLFLETGLPIGLFVPGGDTLLLALGAWAAEGSLRPFPLLPLLFLGSFLGHLLGYALGRYGGKALRRRFPEDLWKKGERLALRFGPLVLLLAPFLGGVRTLVPFLFGAWGFPLARYLPLVALGSLLWTQGLFLLGYLLGRHLPLWAILLGLLLLGGIGLLLSRRPSRAG